VNESATSAAALQGVGLKNEGNGTERFHPVHDANLPDNGFRRRVAIFGGTFDPIHIGHLILAEEAHFQLALDEVFLVPAGDPPHKQDRKLSLVADRFAMCEMATADIDYITVSRMDADRPGPHYTADMVRLMHNEVGPDTRLFFLMGMDSLRDLPKWHEAAWLVENCTLVALSRHDVTLDWAKLETELPGVRERVIILDMPELEIASHQIQMRVKLGQPIRHQVPRLVEGYIQKHKLYLDKK
jgi:nicotinate-nucleotide adenylyltransferase